MEKLTARSVCEFIAKNRIPLKPTQDKICLPILNRIYTKINIGIEFNGIQVADGLIIDGHHRYLASLLAGISLKRFPTHKTSATQEYNWSDISFEEQDWDTEAKIEKLNREDAQANGFQLEEFLRFFK